MSKETQVFLSFRLAPFALSVPFHRPLGYEGKKSAISVFKLHFPLTRLAPVAFEGTFFS